MILVLRASLDIHIPRVPVTIFHAGLRPPMRPDTELCIAKPVGDAVGVERAAGPFEWPRGDTEIWCLAECASRPCPSCRIAQQFQCVAPCKSHGESPPFSLPFVL